MGSLVPPPTSDHFTAELCLVLSSLTTTTGTQFDSLTNQLVRETAESDSEDDTHEEMTDTVEETLSDISTEEENSDAKLRGLQLANMNPAATTTG